VVLSRLAQSPPGSISTTTTKAPPPHGSLHSLPNQDLCDVTLAVNGVLPLWHSHGTISATTATKTPPPWGCVEDIRAGLTHLASPWSLSMPRRTKFQRRPMLPPGTPRAALQHFHLAMRTTGSPSRCRCLTGPNCDTVDGQQCYQCKKVFPKYFSGS
jgi:hypothetical protein